MLSLLVHCLVLSIVGAVTKFSYTIQSPAPGQITCSDPTGCEVSCTGRDSCTGSTINAQSASYLTVTTSHDFYAFRFGVIYCPNNAPCTVIANGTYSMEYATIYCGANGVCDITSIQQAFGYGEVFAQSSTKLTFTADSFRSLVYSKIYCPQSQTTPSCIVKLRSDSSPYWNPSLNLSTMLLTGIYVDDIAEVEFRCDAISDWGSLFDNENPIHPDRNAIYYHSDPTNPQCRFILESYSPDDFFGTNVLGCTAGASPNLLNGKRCLPWTTDSPTQPPTKSPTKSPTIFPTVYPTTAPSKYPSTVPTVYPTAVPTVLPTTVPTVYPSKAPTMDPTTKIPTGQPSLHPFSTPTEAPTTATADPTVSPVYTSDPTASPVSEVPTVSPLDTSAPTASPVDTQTQSPTKYPTVDPTLRRACDVDNGLNRADCDDDDGPSGQCSVLIRISFEVCYIEPYKNKRGTLWDNIKTCACGEVFDGTSLDDGIIKDCYIAKYFYGNPSGLYDEYETETGDYNECALQSVFKISVALYHSDCEYIQEIAEWMLDESVTLHDALSKCNLENSKRQNWLYPNGFGRISNTTVVIKLKDANGDSNEVQTGSAAVNTYCAVVVLSVVIAFYFF